jgi:alkylation response protein AidB-like acyl-CoA dehydrogenase
VARTGPGGEKRTRNITILLIDTRSKGIDIRLLNKIGNKAAGTTEIFLDNVVVPAENVLGDEHKGWYQLVHTLNNERISVAAICLGTTQAVIDESLKYALERKAFDKPIGQFQYIQKYITDMVMGLEAARLLSYKAAWLQSRDKKCNREAAMAKLLASEVAFNATCNGMRIFAGYGYMAESDIQRLWHDSELWLFAPISNEMTRNHLAAELGLPRSY